MQSHNFNSLRGNIKDEIVKKVFPFVSAEQPIDATRLTEQPHSSHHTQHRHQHAPRIPQAQRPSPVRAHAELRLGRQAEHGRPEAERRWAEGRRAAPGV